MAKKKPEILNALVESYLRANLNPYWAERVVNLVAASIKPWQIHKPYARDLAKHIWAADPDLRIDSYKSQPNVTAMLIHGIKEEFVPHSVYSFMQNAPF